MEILWIDGENYPHDELRYNGEGKKNSCINREHAEDIFEARNRNTSKVISKSCNNIAQSTTLIKPINLIWNTHLQLRALDLRNELDMHSRFGVNWSKKHESSASAAAVQPTPK